MSWIRYIAGHRHPIHRTAGRLAEHIAKAFLLALTVGFAAGLAVAAPRPLSVDDLLRLRVLEDVDLSPDGRWVVYTERRLDWAANHYRKHTFIVSADSGDATELIGDAALDGGGEVVGGHRFTPDGRSILWLVSTDDGDQLVRWSMDREVLEQVSRHAGGITTFRSIPGSQRVLFVGRRPRPAAEQREWDLGADAVFVHEGANGLSAEIWQDLWILDLDSAEVRRVSHRNWLIDELDLAPDGRWLAVAARGKNRKNHPEIVELFWVDLDSGTVRRLTDNGAPEYLPRISPDGSHLAYHAPHGSVHELHNGHLWVMDLDSGERRRFHGQHQGEVAFLAWDADGLGLLFSEGRGTAVGLYRLDLDGDTVRPLLTTEGTVRPLRLSNDGRRLIYGQSDLSRPEDLYRVDLASEVTDPASEVPLRLTQANGWIDDIQLGEASVFHFENDGVELEGILVLPPGVSSSDPASGAVTVEEPLPLLLSIQGGPGGFWGNQFEADFHLFAGLGYAVAGVNIRGSSGYGDEHLRALIGDVGGVEMVDVLAGVDHLVARGIADPERLGIRGWSWGGILGAWTIAHDQRFKAASLGAMVGDWTSETGPGLMWDLRDHYFRSHPWDDPAQWRQGSPLSHVARVNTPTLLLHGELDPISTVNQSTVFFVALQERGVPSRFIKFPRQEHSIEEPRLLKIRWREEVRWFEEYLSPPEVSAPNGSAANSSPPM